MKPIQVQPRTGIWSIHMNPKVRGDRIPRRCLTSLNKHSCGASMGRGEVAAIFYRPSVKHRLFYLWLRCKECAAADPHIIDGHHGLILQAFKCGDRVRLREPVAKWPEFNVFVADTKPIVPPEEEPSVEELYRRAYEAHERAQKAEPAAGEGGRDG